MSAFAVRRRSQRACGEGPESAHAVETRPFASAESWCWLWRTIGGVGAAPQSAHRSAPFFPNFFRLAWVTLREAANIAFVPGAAGIGRRLWRFVLTCDRPGFPVW